jgi:hypothetical protein
MPILSATAAISPALSRTRRLLFQPFEWRTFLKLSLVAVFTEGFSGNGNFSHQGNGGFHPGTQPHSGQIDPRVLDFLRSPAFITMVIAFVCVAIVIGLVILYLAVRLRFSLFHCLIHQTTFIAPGWRAYRDQAWRFFLLSIVVGLAYLAIVIGVMIPFIKRFIVIFHDARINGHPDFPALISVGLQLVPVLLAFCLAGIAIDVIMRDFMLPHIALENLTSGEAFFAFWQRFTVEKGSFLLYAFLRIFLPFVAMIGLFVVLAIPMVLIFGIPGLMIAGLHAWALNAPPAVAIFATTLEVLLGMGIAAFGLLVAISFGGPLSIAVRNYALMFYAGRYEPLGDIVFAPPAPVIAPGVV